MPGERPVQSGHLGTPVKTLNILIRGHFVLLLRNDKFDFYSIKKGTIWSDRLTNA